MQTEKLIHFLMIAAGFNSAVEGIEKKNAITAGTKTCI